MSPDDFSLSQAGKDLRQKFATDLFSLVDRTIGIMSEELSPIEACAILRGVLSSEYVRLWLAFDGPRDMIESMIRKVAEISRNEPLNKLVAM